MENFGKRAQEKLTMDDVKKIIKDNSDNIDTGVEKIKKIGSEILNNPTQEGLNTLIEEIFNITNSISDKYSETHNVASLALEVIDEKDHFLKKLIKNQFGSKADALSKATKNDINPIDEIEETIKQEKKPRKKTDKHKEFNFDNVKEEQHNYFEHDSECPCCKEEMDRQEDKVNMLLEFVPSHFLKVYNHSEVYRCRKCHDINGNKITHYNKPDALLEGSYLSASLLTHFAVSKFILHTPIYRLVKFYNNQGLYFNRNTISQGLTSIVNLYLVHLYNAMLEHLRASQFKYCDETTVKLLNKAGKGSIFILSTLDPYKICLFITKSSATREAFIDIVGDQPTYLMCDANNIYRNTKHVTPVLCYAHLRRNFTDLGLVVPEIGVILDKIKHIFNLDEILRFKSDNHQHLKDLRIEQLKPLIDNLFDYLKSTRDKFINRKLILKAYDYALTKEQGFKTFLEDGRLELSNNYSERLAKIQVLGRKNWLHMNSVESAYTSGVLFSILQTAAINQVEPFYYLEYVLNEFATGNIKISNIPDYLPYSPKMKEMFLVNDKE